MLDYAAKHSSTLIQPLSSLPGYFHPRPAKRPPSNISGQSTGWHASDPSSTRCCLQKLIASIRWIPWEGHKTSLINANDVFTNSVSFSTPPPVTSTTHQHHEFSARNTRLPRLILVLRLARQPRRRQSSPYRSPPLTSAEF